MEKKKSARRVLWIVLITPLILSNISCGVFRDITKSKNRKTEKTEIRENSKTSSDEVVLDKSKVITTEKIEKKVTSPTRVVTIETGLDRLKGGNEVTTLDSTGLIRVSILLDSLNNIITTVNKKEEVLTVPMTVTTEEYRDIITKRNQQATLNREEETSEDNLNKETEKTGKNAVWFVILGASVVAAISYLIYRLLKR